MTWFPLKTPGWKPGDTAAKDGRRYEWGASIFEKSPGTLEFKLQLVLPIQAKA
jgi:hypothetical protein